MAYIYPNQRRIIIPAPQFIHQRTLIPPVGFPPASFAAINPNFRPEVLVPNTPPVFAPVGFGLDPSLFIQMDQGRTQSLIQFMSTEGLVPSQEEEEKRKEAITKLKQIVLAWIKRVAWQRRLPKNEIKITGATILTYGSYGLGVHGSESDIDALCIVPFYATMAEDFFIVLRNMLQSRPEVSEIHCVKTAKVPLMRFKFNGISIDLPYAQLPLLSVPDNVDIFNPFLLQQLDETTMRSLSGVCANICICQLVPNLENFQSMLRCVKLWARRRGIYSNLFGFFGGIHLAILAAYVCQRHPNASISALISGFFETFYSWNWRKPVILQGVRLPMVREVSDGRGFMPIMMPCIPYGYCNSNITRGTSEKIMAEFRRGHRMTWNIGRPDFEWSCLFEPFPYTKMYTHFVRILLATSDGDELQDWSGWVKSRIRGLILKLEEMQGFCDPNPTEYVDHDVAEPNTVFYWGLSPNGSHIDIDLVRACFLESVNNGYQGSKGRLELSIVESSQLPKNAQFDSGRSGKGTKASWRILDYSQRRKPVYTRHLPFYFVGYAAADRGDYPSSGG
ncbi:poly(A) polymerase 3 [Tasmannia lanceolata]|uniref:poly(A) polymerase 3 n=1 Tax=Tasmannia lanceolata TaxID=3420 RepID=UPI004063794C